MPPLGEVPRSGKRGVVGDFELLPFIEQHPLSQPLRADSSPIGEPRVAHQPPLKGEDGASRRRGFRRYTEYHSENPRRIRTGPRCPLWGKCREAAKGVPPVALSCFHSTSHTPSVSPYGLPAPPSGSRGIVRIRLGYHEAIGAYRETPQSAPLGLPAPLSGALFSLPPLGEVPRSGKGGAVGSFELFPFNEPHPLSQAVRPASSPIGEPSLTSPERGGRRIAPEGFRGTQNTIQEIQGEFAETPWLPPGEAKGDCADSPTP